jgi:rhodanese-related sulfurtransferase
MEHASTAYSDVEPREAEALIARGAVHCLDVRTPDEFAGLGHIPGALLLPVDLLVSGLAALPRDGRPLLVTCEHGIRSAHAARLLVAAGFPQVLNLAGGMSRWTGPREHSPAPPAFGGLGPSSWLLENAGLLPRAGRALDVACGAGRHALLLAASGLEVRAVDRDRGQLATLRAVAERLRLRLETVELDLETGEVDLGSELFDLVLVVNYLHRPLFPALLASVKPGGLLLYETFTAEQAKRGKPTNPDFLLAPGELRRVVAPFAILREREGEHDGRCLAAVAARKPGV